MRNKNVLFLTQAGLIAALYVVLTLLANALGLASQAIQIRVSEALTVLPLFTPAAIPGLFVGCILGNILTNCAPWDVVFGSLATLLGAFGTYLIAHGFQKPGTPGYYPADRVRKWLCPLPPILANMIIVPQVLIRVYKSKDALWYLTLTVGIGEVITCFVMGMILLFSLEKRKDAIFRTEI